MLPLISPAKRANNIVADEWETGKFDGRANAHLGPPLVMPLQYTVAIPMTTLFVTPAAKCTRHALYSGERHYTNQSEFSTRNKKCLVPTSPAWSPRWNHSTRLL